MNPGFTSCQFTNLSAKILKISKNFHISYKNLPIVQQQQQLKPLSRIHTMSKSYEMSLL